MASIMFASIQWADGCGVVNMSKGMIVKPKKRLQDYRVGDKVQTKCNGYGDPHFDGRIIDIGSNGGEYQIFTQVSKIVCIKLGLTICYNNWQGGGEDVVPKRGGSKAYFGNINMWKLTIWRLPGFPAC